MNSRLMPKSQLGCSSRRTRSMKIKLRLIVFSDFSMGKCVPKAPSPAIASATGRCIRGCFWTVSCFPVRAWKCNLLAGPSLEAFYSESARTI